jgi:hypothetical protein
MYNILILLFSTKRKLLIFEALIDRNEQQEMIEYRFFSPIDRLKVVKPWSLYSHIHTGCWILVKKTPGLDAARENVPLQLLSCMEAN